MCRLFILLNYFPCLTCRWCWSLKLPSALHVTSSCWWLTQTGLNFLKGPYMNLNLSQKNKMLSFPLIYYKQTRADATAWKMDSNAGCLGSDLKCHFLYDDNLWHSSWKWCNLMCKNHLTALYCSVNARMFTWMHLSTQLNDLNVEKCFL